MVTAVVCAAFDADTDSRVLAERDRLAALGVRVRPVPRHRPHLTLVATRVEPTGLGPIAELAARLAARHDRTSVPLDHVGRFDSGVVWLGPRRAPEALRAMQRDAAELLAADGRVSAFAHSEPARWLAHCTLATRVPHVAAVQRELAGGYAPIDASVTGVALLLVGGSGDVALAPCRLPR